MYKTFNFLMGAREPSHIFIGFRVSSSTSLKGSWKFWEDGQIYQLGAGDCALVLPGVPHAFGAAKGSDADVLVTIAPGVERFEYFRILGGIVSGKVPEDELARREDEFDTYFVDAQDWRAHRGG